MNHSEYFKERRKVLHAAADAMEDAAQRNQPKDLEKGPIHLEGFPSYRLGWRGWDLKPKLLEEVQEVLENPSEEELGDVMWVCAMMLDNLKSCGLSNKDELKAQGGSEACTEADAEEETPK